VPNSVIQGLTTTTPAELNRLPAFTMTALLGLFTLVDPKHPAQEVRARPSDILEIVEVGKSVAHAVDREWVTAAGEPRRKRYRARRYSPRSLQMVHAALLALHDQTVVVQRWDPRRGVKLDDRVVHLLDMYGYSYEEGGTAVDVDDLPPGRVKVNVGSPERPVWRVRRRTPQGERFERPSGILFRLNTELANELVAARGSIAFTIIARRVFGLLRRFRKEPAAIRLILLVLRQTAATFRRPLAKLRTDLGWDPEHQARAHGQLEEVLTTLRALGVVRSFVLDQERSLVEVTRNQDWEKEEVCQARWPG
jgi:hypothetical protein